MSLSARRFTLLSLLAALLMACQDRPEASMVPTRELGEWSYQMNDKATALQDRNRAPYSPGGWPLEVGERIRFSQERALADQFASWQGATAVFWVGDQPYGAYYTDDRGGPLPGSMGIDLDFGPYVYLGHFPVTTERHPEEWLDWEWQMVPPHLRSRALVEHLYQPNGASIGGIYSGCNLVAPTNPDCKAQADTLSAWRERLHEPWNQEFRTKGGES